MMQEQNANPQNLRCSCGREEIHVSIEWKENELDDMKHASNDFK